MPAHYRRNRWQLRLSTSRLVVIQFSHPCAVLSRLVRAGRDCRRIPARLVAPERPANKVREYSGTPFAESRLVLPWLATKALFACVSIPRKAKGLASRGVAQSGSAPALGAGCRRFESCLPDHPTHPGVQELVSGRGPRFQPHQPDPVVEACQLVAPIVAACLLLRATDCFLLNLRSNTANDFRKRRGRWRGALFGACRCHDESSGQGRCRDDVLVSGHGRIA
jgi:hypothetical protein